ncbi:MAG: VWA domain-containing protein [Chloroflexi bacterium]|nr:VWA domain-containing protein [Chloroflexota bacterium]MDA1228962.1 VWA domain-containing protein [Chloroflexota bacterium]
MTTYRYSRWDGSQNIFGLDEDDIMDSLADDILSNGDLNRALRNLMQRGMQDENGQQMPGLRDLQERLRQQRQQQLERYNLDSLMDDLKEKLKEVIDTERSGIDKRLQEARQQLEDAGEGSEHLQGAMQMLEDRAEANQEKLESLPDGMGGQIQELQNYDFMDPEARQKFEELLDMLKQQMMQNFFQGMKDQLQDMSPEDMEGLKNMIQALNQMLRDRAMGEDPDFEGFMEQYGQYFDPNRPASLDELLEQLQQQMAAMQSLMESMSPQMRDELEGLMQSAIDPEFMNELGELAGMMYDMFPFDDMAKEYPFMGDESMTLDQAMDVMGQLQGMDQLEEQIKQVMRNGNVEDLDPEKVEEHLGEEARRQLEQLQKVIQQLEDAGYLKRKGDRLELTPRGIRKLAQKALKEVFSELKKDRMGRHEVYDRGEGGERTGETKPYEFGDPFDVDLHRTLFNAVLREGPKTPLSLSPDDFEINRTEHMTQTATVLLLDQSRSMGMFGSFSAAKKVALALYWLIHSEYPRDYFNVIGFSDYGMEIKTDDLAELTWNAWVSGTNMQHGLLLARKALARQKVATKQIIMITDGEPTAHLEGGRAHFSYPPSWRTLDETLKEVKRCTQEGITINTFMLEANYYLVDFIDKMTRINKGRAFYTDPSQLGRYVMVDYLKSRRKRIS